MGFIPGAAARLAADRPPRFTRPENERGTIIMALRRDMPTRDPARQTERSDTYDAKRGGHYPPPRQTAPKPPAQS